MHAISAEAVALLRVELLDAAHQPDVALGNQVHEREPAVEEFLGDADDQAQIGLDHAFAGVEDRDAHLRGPDFFDADNYPEITFRSKRIEGNPPKEEGDTFKVVGDLVIRDTTMEIVLDCEYEGRGTDPWGKTRAGFTFRGEIDRREWGLKWNQALETGGVLVANKVKVEGEVQFVRD